MKGVRPDDRAAGLVLLLGYGIVLVVLFRNPASGFAQATRGFRSALYLLVFPTLGVAAAGYALLGLPYSGGPVFLAASYLGVVGVGIALGGVASPPIAIAGAVAFLLATVALVASLWSFVSSLGVGLDAWEP